MTEKPKPEILGERILILRRRLGLTQSQLSGASGVGTNTIARLERGELRDLRGKRIEALSRALMVTPDQLLGWESIEEACGE